MNGLQLTLDSYLVEAAMDAKREGVAAAAESVTSFEQGVVFDAIGERAPGALISANTLREVLDGADVAAGSRSPMMRAACVAGLLEPHLIEVDGQQVHASVPSTGASAKGAYVKVYRRTSWAWIPAPAKAVA